MQLGEEPSCAESPRDADRLEKSPCSEVTARHWHAAKVLIYLKTSCRQAPRAAVCPHTAVTDPFSSMTRSAVAAAQGFRLTAQRAWSIMRFNIDDTAQARAHTCTHGVTFKTTSGTTGSAGNQRHNRCTYWRKKNGGNQRVRGSMKRGFVFLAAALCSFFFFSCDFSHVAANFAVRSFIFVHSKQGLKINQQKKIRKKNTRQTRSYSRTASNCQLLKKPKSRSCLHSNCRPYLPARPPRRAVRIKSKPQNNYLNSPDVTRVTKCGYLISTSNQQPQTVRDRQQRSLMMHRLNFLNSKRTSPIPRVDSRGNSLSA